MLIQPLIECAMNSRIIGGKQRGLLDAERRFEQPMCNLFGYDIEVESGARRELLLVLPRDANVASQRISVLAPLGTALLGYREGDEFEWVMPGGRQRLRVERVKQFSSTGVSSIAEPFALGAA